jgi:flagellar hook-associated protein 3
MAILPINLARVSNTLQTSVATGNINNTEAQLLTVENQLSTGKAITQPSDDPAGAAVAMQLQKTLDTRQAYATNITSATSQLGEVDSTMSDLTSVLQQAQTIASANVGSDVSADQRASASTVVESLYNQLLSIGNKEFNGSYLFGGDKSTNAPFVEAGGGVEYVGSPSTLSNQVDENTSLAFQVDGSAIFGALSTRIQGTTDLTPALEDDTLLSSLGGANGTGVNLGEISVSDGQGNTQTINLAGANSIGDVITRINSAGIGDLTASLGTEGITISGGTTDDISVNEVGGGSTAADLGILNATGAGAGNEIDGLSVAPTITPLTKISDLNGGAGIDPTGLQITNGQRKATVDFSADTTVEDMLNSINGSNTGVQAEVNAAGTGINILNTTQGTNLSIAENGGTTAQDLGIRSFDPTTQLSDLNGGQGVRTVTGDDFTITDSNGVQVPVDLTDEKTVQDVIDTINNDAGTAGAGVTASFSSSGNGIVLTDTAGGSKTLTAVADNFSNALSDLGLTGTQSGGVITGTDVAPVQASGIFSNIMKLRDALENNDQNGITAAAQGLQDDLSRTTTIHGQVGAKEQELSSTQTQLDTENLATQSLLSSITDTNFTTAITQFQTLQTALQASLQTAGKTLNESLLDFLS